MTIEDFEDLLMKDWEHSTSYEIVDDKLLAGWIACNSTNGNKAIDICYDFSFDFETKEMVIDYDSAEIAYATISVEHYTISSLIDMLPSSFFAINKKEAEEKLKLLAKTKKIFLVVTNPKNNLSKQIDITDYTVAMMEKTASAYQSNFDIRVRSEYV